MIYYNKLFYCDLCESYVTVDVTRITEPYTDDKLYCGICGYGIKDYKNYVKM